MYESECFVDLRVSSQLIFNTVISRMWRLNSISSLLYERKGDGYSSFLEKGRVAFSLLLSFLPLEGKVDDLLLSLYKGNEIVTFLSQKGRGKAFSLLPERRGVGLLSLFQKERCWPSFFS